MATMDVLSGQHLIDEASKDQGASGSGMEVEFEARAYVKMILHAAKYPHCAVNGLLLANKSDASGSRLMLTDCIPLIHQTEGLSPMIEVALAQIESRCDRAGLTIAGFYHAARSMKDCSSVDHFSQKIADKVAENANVSGSGKRSVVLVTVDNKRLSAVMDSHALLVQMFNGNSGSADGKWRHLAARNIGVDEEVLAITSDFVQKKIQKDLFDFDNHLDDVSQDYLNVGINMEIDRVL